MTAIYSFEPIADARATRLILGTMPGTASLQAGQYYAHPRNNFWRFVETVLPLPPALSYEERCAALKANGIAVWDVLQSCVRSGSLDSSIVPATVMPNAFAHFLERHPAIEAIYFNGAAAEKLYRKHVMPRLPNEHQAIPCWRLPSTSPANASIANAVKLAEWRAIARA